MTCDLFNRKNLIEIWENLLGILVTSHSLGVSSWAHSSSASAGCSFDYLFVGKHFVRFKLGVSCLWPNLNFRTELDTLILFQISLNGVAYTALTTTKIFPLINRLFKRPGTFLLNRLWNSWSQHSWMSLRIRSRLKGCQIGIVNQWSCLCCHLVWPISRLLRKHVLSIAVLHNQLSICKLGSL